MGKKLEEMTIATKNMFHGFYGIIRQMFWVMAFVFALGVATPNAQSTAESEYATKVLFMAVDKNDLPGVRAAIEGGADIEAVNPLGMQAVDIAVDRGYYDIAHYLISVRSQLAEKSKNNPAVISSAPPAPADDWAARVTPPAPEQQQEQQEQIAEAKPETPIAEPEIADNAENVQEPIANETLATTIPVPQPRPTIAEAESPDQNTTEAPVELSAVEPSLNSDVNTAPDTLPDTLPDAGLKAAPEPEVVEIAKADDPQPPQSAEEAEPVEVSEEIKEETKEEVVNAVAEESLAEQPEQTALLAPQPSEEMMASEPAEPEIDASANK
ncbi:MAG: ankyrin repeat domain-containing protein, partial [Rhodospirillaceae bacterium]|nr:ankyrin repeat domain-containing protein [Rhodospirillaceae bacterium]